MASCSQQKAATVKSVCQGNAEQRNLVCDDEMALVNAAQPYTVSFAKWNYLWLVVRIILIYLFVFSFLHWPESSLRTAEMRFQNLYVLCPYCFPTDSAALKRL